MQKWSVFEIAMLLLFSLYTSTVNTAVFISLGGDCNSAGITRVLGLRTASYPFDWMYSSFDSVYNAIADDFNHFLEPSSLYVGKRDTSEVIDYYGLQFVHDFPTIRNEVSIADSAIHEQAQIREDWREFIGPIREKYLRRIARFRDTLRQPQHIFFIRYVVNDITTKQQAIKLRDLIAGYYPHAQFTLIIVNDSDEAELDWGMDRIRNFTIRYECRDFQNKWRDVFEGVGVTLTRSAKVSEFSQLERRSCGCLVNIHAIED